MYLKCFSCRLYDSLICGRFCKGYSHFEPINRRLFHYVNSQNQVLGPVEAYMLPFYGVNQDSYVWAKGMRNWMKVSHVPELHFIPSASTTYLQHSTDIYSQEKTVSSILGSIPLGTKIVYALYLLVLLYLIFFHCVGLIELLMAGDSTDLIFFLGGGVLVIGISIWGIWQIFRHYRKAGVWFASLSCSMFLMLLSAIVGLEVGTKTDQMSGDISYDYTKLILGLLCGLVLSYIIIGVLWFSLYFKRNGVAFILRLNDGKLIFPLSILRLQPIVSLLLIALLLVFIYS